MIAGCVILYNPDFEVIENILSYANFVQVLYVVDNSDAKNSTIITAIKSIENAVYIDNKSNLGISSALNIGCEQAEKAGYSWILTMDQDTKFKNTDFFKLFDANIRPGIAIYAASYTNEYDRWVKPYNNDFNEIHFVVTSGNLLNLKIWRELGRFEDKLFIDEVDHDYCIKARQKGYNILTSCKIFLEHGVGVALSNQNNKVFVGHSPVRYYYITRNTLYIIKKYVWVDFKLVYNRIRHLSKNVVKIALFYPNKKQYAKAIVKGVTDFTKGRYGKMII